MNRNILFSLASITCAAIALWFALSPRLAPSSHSSTPSPARPVRQSSTFANHLSRISHLDEISESGTRLRQWAIQDFPAFQRWLAKLPNDAQAVALESAFSSTASDQIAENMSILGQLMTLPEAASARTTLFLKWSDAAPQAAAEFLSQARNLPDAIAAHALANFFTSDPTATLELLENTRIPPFNEATLSQLCREISAKAPIQALAIAATLPPGPAGDELLQLIVFQSGLSLAEMQKLIPITAFSEDRKEAIYKAQAMAWAAQDGEAAAKWSLGLDPAAAAHILPQVIGLWTNIQPEPATRFVQNIADPQLQILARNALMQTWYPADAEAAQRWYSQVTGGKVFIP